MESQAVGRFGLQRIKLADTVGAKERHAVHQAQGPCSRAERDQAAPKPRLARPRELPQEGEESSGQQRGNRHHATVDAER